MTTFHLTDDICVNDFGRDGRSQLEAIAKLVEPLFQVVLPAQQNVHFEFVLIQDKKQAYIGELGFFRLQVYRPTPAR